MLPADRRRKIQLIYALDEKGKAPNLEDNGSKQLNLQQIQKELQKDHGTSNWTTCRQPWEDIFW